jgi:hypothetical protein
MWPNHVIDAAIVVVYLTRNDKAHDELLKKSGDIKTEVMVDVK